MTHDSTNMPALHQLFRYKHRYVSNVYRGFTLIELVVVMAIFLTMATLITINLGSAQSKTSLRTQLDVITSSFHEQQMKAMLGDTAGETTGARYGVHFDQNSYTLFRGDTYVLNDPHNFVVEAEGVEFVDITFPNGNIIFSQGSGEIVGYSNITNTLTVRHLGSLEEKTVSLNEFGIITSIN